MNGDQRYRVFNRCKHDIGVMLSTGMTTNIRSGSFAVLSANDILYIESICNRKKFFSSGMLVAVDDNGKDMTLEDVGGFTDSYTEKHYDDEEIKTNLKKPFKAFESWLKKIDDPVELHSIWEIGKAMNLPASKLKVLQAKIPNKDLLDDVNEEE